MCSTYNPEAPCVVEHSDRRHEILIGDDGVFDAVSKWMSLPEHKKTVGKSGARLATSIVESFNNMAITRNGGSFQSSSGRLAECPGRYKGIRVLDVYVYSS